MGLSHPQPRLSELALGTGTGTDPRDSSPGFAERDTGGSQQGDLTEKTMISCDFIMGTRWIELPQTLEVLRRYRKFDGVNQDKRRFLSWDGKSCRLPSVHSQTSDAVCFLFS